MLIGILAPIATHFMDTGAHEQLSKDLVLRIEKDETEITTIQHIIDQERHINDQERRVQQSINEDFKINLQKIFDALENIKTSLDSIAHNKR